jgi:hypothetical protein
MRSHRLRASAALISVLMVAGACGGNPFEGLPFSSITPPPVVPGTPLPRQVFAPYFETWAGQSMTGVADASGARYFTAAFMQAASKGSCILTWNGDSTASAPAGLSADDLALLRKAGGDMIPSLGGYEADNKATEIADSCETVADIATAYESVVTRYDVTRLDMDIEDNSLTNTAGIERRSQAIKLLQDWATANKRPLQISYTLPTGPGGLEPSGLAVLQSAIDAGARVDVVNIMTFDYYDGTTTDMAAAAISALTALHGQLATLYPSKSDAEIWAMEAVTLMIGIDDYPGKTEVTSVSDAGKVLEFARAKGMSTLSFWAVQRDTGDCVGTAGADNCSGVAQKTWEFSQKLATFTAK